MTASQEPGILATKLHADGAIPTSCACRAASMAARWPAAPSCTWTVRPFKLAVSVLEKVAHEALERPA
jgi:3-oxoacyl-[acyl-carrier-protein] synthase-3